MEIPAPPRDALSFDAFYDANRGPMMALVRWQTAGKVKDIELTAEEGWGKFLPHWRDCDDPDVYVRRCMISESIRAGKKARNEPSIVTLDAATADVLMFEGRAAQAPPSTPMDHPWDPELLTALSQLSDRLRAAVLLDVELEPGQRSAAEIAQILGINRVAAAMRLARAYAQLRNLLPEGYLELCRARRRGSAGLEGGSAT